MLACEDRFANERPFFRQDKAAQYEQFRALAPEQQVRLFLVAQAAEPPDLTFCDELKKSAELALPAILKALVDEKEDREKRSLLLALECVRDRAAKSCDPRVSPIAVSVAKSILDKELRNDAVQRANALRCP
jgi:hypothetical protein